MVFINPIGLSNSGAPEFTGQRSSISKYAFNLVQNGNSQYYWFFNPQNIDLNNNTNSNTNIINIDFRSVLAQQKANTRQKKLQD